VNDRHVRLSSRFFISNQNLCTFIYDMVLHPAHAFERSKLMKPFLQTESLLQLWFTHAKDTQLAARRPHRPQHPHLMFPIWNCGSFDIFVRPVDGGI
jgi:hypothetical protein